MGASSLLTKSAAKYCLAMNAINEFMYFRCSNVLSWVIKLARCSIRPVSINTVRSELTMRSGNLAFDHLLGGTTYRYSPGSVPSSITLPLGQHTHRFDRHVQSS